MSKLGSMYAQFQNELYNRETFEDENGFIVYNSYDDGSIYLHIIFIKPDKRRKDEGTKLYKKLIDKLKPNVAYCYVDLTTNNPTLSLNSILSVGFEIFSANAETIVLKQEYK